MRLRVRVENESILTRNVELRIRATFRRTTWDPVDARAVRLLIADFVARSLSRQLTAESICTDLETRGFVPSQLAGNASVGRRLQKLNRAHLADVRQLRINGADSVRHEGKVAVRALLELERHVMLEGGAGSGKSCAAAQMLRQLPSQDVLCLSVRQDRHDQVVSSSDASVTTVGGGRRDARCRRGTIHRRDQRRLG